VPNKYREISDRLKAYRLGSGLSADEIATRAGISRAALYRFEKGQLAKIETLEKLAALLEVSMPTLLGVGIEYMPSPASYFERMRQIEVEAKHISVIAGPIPFLLSSDKFSEMLPTVLRESVPEHLSNRNDHLVQIDRIVESLSARKVAFRSRQPGILNLISAREVRRLLRNGLVGNSQIGGAELIHRRELAREEVSHLISVIEDEIVGNQIGILTESLPYTGFQLFRMLDRKILAISPFRLGVQPNIRVGVAMITSAHDAIKLHEIATQQMWRDALKGLEAAAHLRYLLKSND
jgi:transcriptional regulator with XRE-family HTH domain